MGVWHEAAPPDGGLSSLAPVRAAPVLGAKAVIAIDIYCHGPRAAGQGALAIASLADRDEQTAAVQAGYLTAQEAMPRIRTMLETAQS